MPVLCIETTGKLCGAALMRGEEVLASCRRDAGHAFESHLPALVTELLPEKDFAILDKIVICVGPGSFTGIRAGIAFGRALALACKIPSIGVTGLAAIFAAAGAPTQRCLVARPARKRPPDKSWWLESFANGRSIAPPVEADSKYLQAALSGTQILISEDIALQDLPTQQNASCRFVSAALTAGAAGAAAELGLTASNPATPLYGRAPDARPGLYEVAWSGHITPK